MHEHINDLGHAQGPTPPPTKTLRVVPNFVTVTDQMMRAPRPEHWLIHRAIGATIRGFGISIMTPGAAAGTACVSFPGRLSEMDYQIAWQLAGEGCAFLPDEEHQPHLSFDLANYHVYLLVQCPQPREFRGGDFTGGRDGLPDLFEWRES
jgi:hypothetical protein